MKVRNVVEQVENHELQMFFKAQYLLGARASELTGKIHPSDKLKEPLGPKSSDVSEGFFEKLKIPVFLFTVKSERVKLGDPPFRIIALPKDGDPWAYELFKHFKETKDNKFVFPYTRQRVQSTIRETGVFNDLKYSVTSAKQKPFPNDKLRKVRIIELQSKYGFKRDDLEAYGITKIHETTIGIDMNSLINNWETYICKLYNVDMQAESKKTQNAENKPETYKAEWGWSKGTLVLHNIKYGYTLCQKTDEIYPLKSNETPNPKRMCKPCLHKLRRIENPPKESTSKIKKIVTLADFNNPNTK